MRDFLPSDKRRREVILQRIRDVYRRHGFDEIETPVVEDASRLHAGLGGDNEKLSYGILQRGLDAETVRAAADNPNELCDLGLRYDLTVPLARFYASHRAELPAVFRSIQIAPVWRAERPQKGRYRQFMQCDIDILGEAGPLAEIELIEATSAVLAELGLRDCTIRVNDRRVLTALLRAIGIPEAEWGSALISFDKLDKIGVEGVTKEIAEIDADAADRMREVLERLAPVTERGGAPLTRSAIESLVPEIATDEQGSAAIDSLSELGEALGGIAGVEVRFDPTIVRGMGYYTGTIFEIAHPASGSSVGGGGRYDGMIGRFLGTEVPACGFSIGFERIVDIVDIADATADHLALVYDRALPAPVVARAKAAFVAKGRRVTLEKRTKNVAAVLDSLAARGVQEFAFVSRDFDGDIDALEFKELRAS